EERLRTNLPLRAERVLHRIRETRGGKLYDSRWNVRGRGEGLYADTLEALFDATARKLGLDGAGWEKEPSSTFRRPIRPDPQLTLFTEPDRGPA
ncbi:MAG TPA: radical SAM protein, partial [Myxococcaceae bacterium]|nr:radical SAM protein [Myxococcaceae bacterium]